jgi:hypothetical protein
VESKHRNATPTERTVSKFYAVWVQRDALAALLSLLGFVFGTVFLQDGWIDQFREIWPFIVLALSKGFRVMFANRTFNAF